MHVPLNDSTRHMIGAAELALMKPEAIIVNTSRGPVIDEMALTKALADNKLFGAGLDVFDQEPPPPDNPIVQARERAADVAFRRTRPGTITWRASATPSTTCSACIAARSRCGWCRSWRNW